MRFNAGRSTERWTSVDVRDPRLLILVLQDYIKCLPGTATETSVEEPPCSSTTRKCASQRSRYDNKTGRPGGYSRPAFLHKWRILAQDPIRFRSLSSAAPSVRPWLQAVHQQYRHAGRHRASPLGHGPQFEAGGQYATASVPRPRLRQPPSTGELPQRHP